jgi:hypothetical protein
MAAELDIPAEDVEAAIEGARTEAEDAAVRKQYIAARRATFVPHAIPFVVVNLMCYYIWMTTGGGYPWYLWTFFGWGIGLAAHAAAVLPTKGQSFETGLAAAIQANRARNPVVKRRPAAQAKMADASATAIRPERPGSVPATVSAGAVVAKVVANVPQTAPDVDPRATEEAPNVQQATIEQGASIVEGAINASEATAHPRPAAVEEAKIVLKAGR